MSRIQDYIAKVRYQNDLPPPLIPPKLLKYSISEVEDIQSSSLLTSLYRKENVNNLIAIDNDIGTAIDLVSSPNVFDIDPTADNERPDVKLDENDRFLLRDPGIAVSIKAEPNVAFLRRTEYTISTKSGRANKSRSQTPLSTNNTNKIDTQLHAIESSFEKSTKTLKDPTAIRHPLKKNLKIKKVWSLLPDVSRMDQVFSTIRFANNRTKDSKLVDTSILKAYKLNPETDWCSFYLTESESSSNEIKNKLNNLNESLKIDENEEEETRFKYIKEGEYALQFDKNFEKINEITEIALRFDDRDDVVYYNPINSKAELKRRKLPDSLKEAYDDLDLDEIDVKFKEPTIDDLNERNNKRHKFDDITYESIDKINEEKLEYEERDEDKDEEEDDLEAVRRMKTSL